MKRLSQTLYRIASAMLKKSLLTMKYWSKLILVLDYLQNWLLVVDKPITSYKAYIKHKPNLKHLRQIG